MVQLMIAGRFLDYVESMLLILLLQLPLVRADSNVREATVCTHNACFSIHMESISFKDACAKCKDNGGYLVTSRDNREVEELQSILSQIDKRHRIRDMKLWIGLQLHKGDCMKKELSLKGFKWIFESEHSEYSNWEKEPTSTCTEERCVFVHYSYYNPQELKWTDSSCKDKAFYACKFYFMGMCKPLLLAEEQQVNYNLPFSTNPLNQDNTLTTFPFGTYAEITCRDNFYQSIICIFMDGLYRWTDSGPFCDADKQSCGYKNGGCEHLCNESDAGSVRCECKDGYVLSKDKKSCGLKDYCHTSMCEHQCVSGPTGFSCVCPNGFNLDDTTFGCTDVDECQNNSCDGHECINTQGSYTCKCKDGYTMVGGKCHDIDECLESRSICHQRCLNAQGSYSCHCLNGFTVSKDGHTCVDIDECLSNRCEGECINTIGSFRCSCHENYHLHINAITCIPDVNVVSTPETSSDHTDSAEQNELTESITISTVGLLNEPQFTDGQTQYPLGHDIMPAKPSSKPIGTRVNTHNFDFFSSWLFICVIASVVPLLILIAVTSGIVVFRCSRSKKEARKKVLTADSYCWVASGLETQLQKCDRSQESTA